MDLNEVDDTFAHDSASLDVFQCAGSFATDHSMFGHADDQPGLDDNPFGDPSLHEPDNHAITSCPLLSGEPFDAPPSHRPELGAANSLGLEPVSGTVRGFDIESQPTLPAHVHDASFARALLSNCRTTDIVLPWETSFYKELFGDEPFSQPLVPEMPIGPFCDFSGEPEPQVVAQTVAAVASFPSGTPVFSACVGSTDDGPFVAVQSRLHNTAVQKLLVVLRHDLSSSETGRHILALGDETAQQQGAHKIIEAVIGTRAPSTLVKRSNALLSYLRWFDKLGRAELDPFTEACIWMYFQNLKEDAAPCTKGSSALSAFRFAFHLLGFEGLGPALNSRRLIGICELMLAQKRLLKQALVLTVAQVKGLHKSLRDGNMHIMDRAVIAYILFALYGRCRNSDLLMIHSVEPDFSGDGGYVTVQTCNHKTGRMAMLKSRLMPIVVPARGVDGLVWVGDALNVFEEAGVAFCTPIDGPLLRAPLGTPGEFMQRGLRASEVSALVRRFIGSPEPCDVPSGAAVSSHSLKATTLSWCARYGLSPAVRSILGRHASSLNETFAIYSRDLVCSPVAELQKVIDAIAEGSFQPDSQRQSFLRSRSPAVAQDGAQEDADHGATNEVAQSQTEGESNVSLLLECSGGEVVPTELDPGTQEQIDGEEAADPEAGPGADVPSCSSSSDSDDALSSAESVEHEFTPRVKRFRAKIPENQLWFVHSKSHLVRRHDGDVHDGIMFTVCGRRITGTYSPCTEATAWNILCKSCNRK